jgi:hypothetical protein
MFSHSKKLLICCFYTMLSLTGAGQSQLIEVYGNVTDDNRDLVGVLIQVTQGSRVVVSTKTDPNGEYAFQLPFGGEFLAEVSREGYVTKKFTISTMGIPPEKKETKFQPIGASISLFRRLEGIDYSLLNQPMMKFRYNPQDEGFEYDKAHQAQMSEGLERIKEAEKDIKRAEKEREAKYASLVKEGDRSFGKKDYQASINSYKEAMVLKPKESYPQAQVEHISKLMEEAAAQAKADEALKAQLAAEAAAKKAAEEAAAKARADADAAAKAKAEKELADKLAKEKAEADAKAKAEAEAKAKAEKELADKLAKEKAETDAKAKAEADARAKAEADALAKKQADEAARKAREDAEAQRRKAEEDAIAKRKADEAAAKAKAEQELAEKMAREKAETDKKAADELAKKQAAEALVKKNADEAAKAKAEKELAEKLAKEKSEAEAAAKAKAEKDLSEKLAKDKADAEKKAADDAAAKLKAEKEAAEKLAKEKADKEIADKLAKDKEAADKAAREKAEALTKAETEAKEQAAKAEREKLTADASKGKSDKSILPALGADDSKYKEAIRKADNFFALKRYLDAKKYYEEALTLKGGDPYAKEKLMECEKLTNSDANQITDERQKKLLAKYPEGVTEETIPGDGVVIVKRVLVQNRVAFVYEKKIFNWGGIACFRDGIPITELVFDQETKK